MTEQNAVVFCVFADRQDEETVLRALDSIVVPFPLAWNWRAPFLRALVACLGLLQPEAQRSIPTSERHSDLTSRSPRGFVIQGSGAKSRPGGELA